jgi:vitamin B12 transporter
MNQQANKTALAAAISLSLFSLSAAANEPPNRLDTVQVTATRTELPIEQALASVTVLDRADIERSQAPDLLDLLARQAGVDVARNGGPGQASTVFLRGSNSTHALVLVDGVRVNAATQGLIDFAHFPLAQIERIEIVRGPRAALWGSDAIGGVIQIFTRDPASAFVEARIGSYERRGLDVGAGWAQGDTRIGVSVGSDRLEGFSATGPSAGPYSYDPDPDGYSNRHFSLRARSKLGNQDLGLTALVSDADVDFDAGVAPGEGQTAALNRVFGATVSGGLTENWNHALTLGHSSEDLYTPVYFSRFGSRRDSLDWIVDGSLGEGHELSVGLNWSQESGYSDEFGSGFDVDRRNSALFARWQGRFGAQSLQASIRHDDNSQFGGANTANLAWGWKASESLNLRASWGQGFRAPSLNELYYPGFFAGNNGEEDIYLFAGNAQLQPERSQSFEAGLDWQADANQRLGLSLYRTRIHDLIAFTGEDFQAMNTRRAGIDGAELEYHWTGGGYSFNANATWQRARDLDTGARLLRRADRKLNASLDRNFANGASVGLDLTAVSRRPEFGGQEIGGYGRVDLRAAAPLAGNWSAELRLENLGNRDYELVQGYLTPGRSGMISLRWKGQ